MFVSIIVPAYNERERLPAFLRSVRLYCETMLIGNYEVIVVNDGSADGTREFIDQLAGDWPRLRPVHHATNLGKGAALRSGVEAAHGDYLLLADADGATPIGEERNLRAAVAAGADIAVGSRAARGHARPFVRRFLSGAFYLVSRRLFKVRVRDSQCGFKMFRRGVGERLAALTKEPGYLFDFEVLVLAERFGYNISEVPVAWRDVPGSKVRIVRDSWNMLWGLARLWARPPTGRAASQSRIAARYHRRRDVSDVDDLGRASAVQVHCERRVTEAAANRTDRHADSALIGARPR